jgi:hypothetical protein
MWVGGHSWRGGYTARFGCNMLDKQHATSTDKEVVESIVSWVKLQRH